MDSTSQPGGFAAPLASGASDQQFDDILDTKQRTSTPQEQHPPMTDIPVRIDSVLPSAEATKEREPWRIYAPHSALMRKSKLEMLEKRFSASESRDAAPSVRLTERPPIRSRSSTQVSEYRKQPSRLQLEASFASIDIGIPTLPCTNWQDMSPMQRKRYHDELSMYSGSSVPLRPMSRPVDSSSNGYVRKSTSMDESRQASASRLQALGEQCEARRRSSSRSSRSSPIFPPLVEKEESVFSARSCMNKLFCRRSPSATEDDSQTSLTSPSRLPVRVGTTLPAKLKSRAKHFVIWYKKTVPQAPEPEGLQAEALATAQDAPATATQPEESSVPSPDVSIRPHTSSSTPIVRPSTTHDPTRSPTTRRRRPNLSRSMSQLRNSATSLNQIPENTSLTVSPSTSRKEPRRSPSTDSTRSLEDRLRNTRLEDLASISASDAQEISKLVRELDSDRQAALGTSAGGGRSADTVVPDTPRQSLEDEQVDGSRRLVVVNGVVPTSESGASDTATAVPDEV